MKIKIVVVAVIAIVLAALLPKGVGAAVSAVSPGPCPEYLTITGLCMPESEIIPISLPIPAGWEDISDIYAGYDYRVTYVLFPDMGKWESVYPNLDPPEGFPDDYMIMIVKYDIITIIPDSFGRTFYFRMSSKPFLYCDQRVQQSAGQTISHGSIFTGHTIKLATTGGWYPPKSEWEAWRLPKCDIPGMENPTHNNNMFEFYLDED